MTAISVWDGSVRLRMNTPELGNIAGLTLVRLRAAPSHRRQRVLGGYAKRQEMEARSSRSAPLTIKGRFVVGCQASSAAVVLRAISATGGLGRVPATASTAVSTVWRKLSASGSVPSLEQTHRRGQGRENPVGECGAELAVQPHLWGRLSQGVPDGAGHRGQRQAAPGHGLARRVGGERDQRDGAFRGGPDGDLVLVREDDGPEARTRFSPWRTALARSS